MTDSIEPLDQYLDKCRNPDTKDIFDSCIKGYYLNDKDKEVHMEEQIHECLINTKSYPPDYDFKLPQLKRKEKGVIEVRNETTVRGALRLIVEENKKNVCALNFANAFRPGGGVLSFSRAQEESICRSSALFYSLIQKKDFYDYHNEQDTNLASNYLIFSPDCPTWKVDGVTLNNPIQVSYVTSAAVHNFGVQSREEIQQIHHERIKAILYCSICNGVKNIILGAFGCGAFSNNPEDIAKSFKYWLVDENLKDYFESISFSIIERSDRRINSSLKNIDVFAEVFGLSIIKTEQFDQKEIEQKELENEEKPHEKKKCSMYYSSYSDYVECSDESDDFDYEHFYNDYWSYYYNYYYDYYYYYYYYYWNRYNV